VTRGGGAGNAPRPRRDPASRRTRSRAATPRKATRSPADRRRRQTTLTARAAVLAVAVASVALALALPFKIWLGQRGEIASLAAQEAQARQQVARLSAERQRWKDPAYVEQQARLRLHYVLPGQKTLVVLGHRSGSGTKPATTPSPPSTSPWYSQLWQSAVSAGR
jgi:cell division protein FtsB